jgi:hypothetical protein
VQEQTIRNSALVRPDEKGASVNMPNRIVRENILSSIPVSTLGWPEEVFFRRIMSVADDYGRYEALPQLLRARCYPLQTEQVRVADITRWMAACQKAGLIVLYEVDGKQYLEIAKFGQQQRSASKFPQPPANDISCNQMISNAHLVVSVSEVVSEARKAQAPLLALPDWLPLEAWEGFLAMRTKMRKPPTPRAMKMLLCKLEVFREKGLDTGAVLDASTQNNWIDLYAPKSNGNGKIDRMKVAL